MKPLNPEIRTLALARIHEYEDWLASYGIVAQAGMEQEFLGHVPLPGYAANYYRAPEYGVKSRDFNNSDYIEEFHREGDARVSEVTIGRGNGKGEKSYPDVAMSPSAIVKKTEAARRKIETSYFRKKKYIERISYGMNPDDPYSPIPDLHCGISLWFRETASPLLINTRRTASDLYPNALSLCCIESMLEAQHALVALVVPDAMAIARFQSTDHLAPKAIRLSQYKHKDAGTLMFRSDFHATAMPAECYLENRIPGGDADPALVMLMSLSGMVSGLKKYMARNSIRTPEEFKAHLATQTFMDGHLLDYSSTAFPKYPLPPSMEQTAKTTRESAFAKEYMGIQLHDAFCDAYLHQNKEKSAYR